MMFANDKKPGWLFYPIWVILTCLAVPIAFFLGFAILRIIIDFVGDFIYVDGVRHITEDYLGIYVFVPVVGLVTGVVQYGLLRRYMPRMGWWVLATAGGWLLGVLLIAVLGWLNWSHEALNLDLAFILMGLSIGVAQWLLLQRHLPGATWWIAANVVGWGLLALITQGNSLDQFGLFALAFFPACATAATLAFLLNRLKLTQPNGV